MIQFILSLSFFCLEAKWRAPNRDDLISLGFMTIHYKTLPSTFEELSDAIRGQLERAREEAIYGRTVPTEECVQITADAFLALIERIEQLGQLVNVQADINNAIQQLFLIVFDQMGIDMGEMMEFMDDEEE